MVEGTRKQCPIIPVRLLMALAACACCLPLASATAATVGSVFVSYADDGSPRYASQRLDASYRLFIRGATVRKQSSTGPRKTTDRKSVV